MNNQPTNTFRLPANKGTRIEWLIVVRETTMYSPDIMLEVLTQTLKQWDHLDGVTDVLALGLDPIQQGEATLPNGKQLQLRMFEASDYRAVLFEHEDVMYLYSMGSAATTNAGFRVCSDVFVELLCDVIKAYRPIHLNVATFGSLIDISELTDRLHAAVKAHVEVLYFGFDPMSLKRDTGALVWDVLAVAAAMEREKIAGQLPAGPNRHGLYPRSSRQWN